MYKLRIKKLLIVISVVLLGMVVTQSIMTPITHDEAMGYFYVFSRSWQSILGFGFESSNNHILNSILTKASIEVFGDHLFMYRIPAMLGFLLYLYGAYRISLRRKNPVIVFLLLTTNPFLLDFFSLSRGYGLALGFTMLALDATEDEGDWLHICLFMSFATLANFSFITVYAALGIWLLIAAVFQAREKLPAIIMCGCLSLLAVMIPLTRLVIRNELYFGGTEGLVSDTLTSIIRAYLNLDGTGISVVSVGLFFGALCVSGLIEKSWQTALTITILLVILAQHYLLGSRFPVQRGAIYLIPLFSLVWYEGLDNTYQPRYLGFLRKPMQYMQYSLILVIIANIATWSPSVAYYDKRNADVRQVIEAIQEDAGDRKVRVGILSLVYDPNMNYYIQRDQLPIEFLRRGGLVGQYDYYIVGEKGRAHKDIVARNPRLLQKFERSGVLLLKQ